MPDRQLPPLSPSSTVPSAPSAGDWDWHSEKVLSDIGKSLEADVNPQFFDVDAIPDIWARPILFRMAFGNDDHPLHEKVLGEWRGMITLIALSEWNRPPLEAQSINLAAFDGENGASGRFAETARRMVPKESIDSETDWKQLHVFRYDGRPIAITSPTTLVATATDYSAHGVRWYNGRVLRDPIGVRGASSPMEDELSKHEKTALVQWLRHIQGRVTNGRAPEDGDGIKNAVLAQTRSFIEDLSPNTVDQQFDIRNDAFGMTTGGLLKHLDEVPSLPQADSANSQVRLVPDGDREVEDGLDLLIIGDEIARQWDDVRAQDVIVHGADTLASVGTASGSRDTLNQRNLQGAEWRYADDLFSENLALVDESGALNQDSVALPEGTSLLDVTPIIPLSEEVLDFISPRSLSDRVRFSRVGDDYRVEVDLPLSGPGAQPRDVTFERMYERSELVFNPEPPSFEIWPDFEAPDWSEYYTYYDGPGRFYLEAYPRPDDGKIQAEKLRQGEVGRAIGQTHQYPEAILCHSVDGEQYLGLVPLRPPKEASAASSDSWTVGVDFGTSNTTAYVSEAGEKARPVRFNDRLVPITEKSRRTLYTTKNFLPASHQDVPFLTFFHDLPTGRNATPTRDIQVPQEGHVFYVDSPGDRDDLDPSMVHHDLKWSEKPADRARTKAFLEQIVLQVQAEAAANRAGDIRWRYSYPSSFSKNQLDSLQGTWKSIVGDAEQRSESLSTATYFLEAQGAPMVNGSVCVDIGGASTDVAIWQNNETLLQSSLRLAGREILLKTIAAEPGRYARMLNSLGSDYGGDLLERAGSQEASITDLEELIVLEGEEMLEHLPKVSDTEEVAHIQQHVAFGLSGLFYYIGMLIRHLVNEGAFDPEAQLPNFYFAGNGSKMLDWLDHGGSFGSESRVNRLFEEVLVQASGLDGGNFKVERTRHDQVKHEVAYGLVFDRNLEVQRSGSVVAGEAFTETADQRAWETRLTPEVLSQGVELDDLDRLRNLVTTFNRLAEGSDGLLDPVSEEDARFERARETVRSHLHEYRAMESENIDVEPLFVLGVKAFLDDLRE